MILIADSGSTKCDWVLLNGSERVAEVDTIGFNPFYYDEQSIANVLSKVEVFASHAAAVTEVHFYGSGCSSPERNVTVENALKLVFPNAAINVGHDVLGAALAACQGEKGIACILGTGSNSCYYDGKDVSEVIPSLGYILGDEGSGAWFGKKLITDYLYKESIPIGLKQELESKRHTKGTILENIYMKPHANVYLASFMTIIANHRQTEYVHKLMSDGMRQFLQRHICCFDNYKDVKSSFVGSVAYHFQDFLQVETEKLHIPVGNIIKRPIDGLVAFHLKDSDKN
jgi:glucosamine kinase